MFGGFVRLRGAVTASRRISSIVVGSPVDVDGADTVLAGLRRDVRRARCMTHIERVPARDGCPAPWPDWIDPVLRGRWTAAGIASPWSHQAAAAEAAYAGRSVVLATGTASGKSLGYLMPVLSRLLAEPGARALYLAPTKALAHDQLRAVRSLRLTGIRAAAFDGDTPAAERDWVRAHAGLVLTNPDMLHRGILPFHRRWTQFLRGLRYVVVDECHGYRGVFGAHVAAVIRRLRRICARYGTDPVFLLASATVADPGVSAARLTGVEVEVVDVDGSPRGPLDFVLYEPPLLTTGQSSPDREDPTSAPGPGENGAPVRRSVTAESADLLTDLVADGVRTLVFVRSRRAAEVVAVTARRELGRIAADLADRVAAYRAGYLPEERRALEEDLRSGALLGAAATSALELGVDISGLDATVTAGFPGTLASLWQQAGRAGRDGRRSLAVLVARDDPLDTYLVHHPEAVFGRPVEASVFDPDNPYVLAPHLECAAAELALTEADLALFGPTAAFAVNDLVRRGRLRRRPTGWFWTQRARPDVDIRGAGGPPVRIVEARTGRLLGTVDAATSHTTVHAGAVYLHQGSSFVVEDLDLEESVAFVCESAPEWTTTARDHTDIRVVESSRSRVLPDVEVHLGVVEVTSQVVGYQRRLIATGEVLGQEPLDLPPRQLRTRAVWYTLSDDLLARAAIEPADVPGAVHAAEHAAIGLLPLFATCDRWDIGGVSTALHPDTERTSVFVYDGHAGGAGFAERGFLRIGAWLAATRDAIEACECPAGCPSCVQSPKCGNGNEPLDKAAAWRLLAAVTAMIG
ncbi:helicase family protein with metal-binding cysteine cluster [Frankia casuarinae]|uniref:DEAD/DEAH box helicase-like n=4 Tax=Frankia TaxID=1854 RepID=Q2J4Z5_FRACC|nr:DEAD/DEAH box helicase-like [Frankia casuarinae]ETA02601.1 helicase family protein with metal-binding cysteine cluster [Frankia sp. CcI6]KDA43245.1 helicase family protein with metal-binding cysteine cluster [Frankia sp. BMG5.23]KEZ37964.1 helicase/secretion neighborhood putative DEAH-box helicase [Frankia sp. CeD]OHV49614.1 DEAD/DEAH box helicase [Frankia sp. CgIS1]TFE32620.1 DEAD/DEAH box helicase [Frankia sp. B2]